MPSNVDILLSVYNGQMYLPQLLESLEAQSHKDIKLIIRDDGSNDNSAHVIEEFKRNTSLFCEVLGSSENLGAIGSFNELMAASTSDHIMFCDQDDVWLPEKVSRTLSAMVSHEHAHPDTPMLLHTDLKVADEDLKPIASSMWTYQGIDPVKGQQLNRLLIQNAATGCATMINRNLLIVAPSVPEGAIMHDWYLAVVAAACGKVFFVDEPLLLYRQHGDNTIGAFRYSAASVYKKAGKEGTSGVRSRLESTFNQARVVYENIESMPEGSRDIINAYLNIPESGFIKRRTELIKYGFLKSGLLRNIGLFIFI